ncbi:EamA family transporter [Vibrio coralliilyticus]|uniref:EamA family transporter n=1 Tax=Vibrio coralliilyticus TaxID=190893 RepID=A0AAP7DFQ0_9VIBR|nr:EamA family transporter [Vibrio coralliilyticus]NOJ26259.1 EamA family transporter [Vibrio coralliilyticus]
MSLKDYTLCVLIMAFWGVNFSVVKLGLEALDPMLLTALRFALAAIPAVFFVKKPDVHWGYLAAYGLTFALGVWGLSTWAIGEGLSPGMAALLIQTNVVFGLGLGWWLLKESVSPRRSLGAAIALCGLTLSLTVTDGSVTASGVGLILVAALCWSLSGVILKRSQTKQVFAFSVWSMLFAPLPLCLLSYLQVGAQGFDALIGHMTLSGAFSIVYQAYFTTLFGYWIWNKLVMSYHLSHVAPFTLLVPIFALLGSSVWFHEGITTQKVVSCALIALGLLIGSLPATKFTTLALRLRKA